MVFILNCDPFRHYFYTRNGVRILKHSKARLFNENSFYDGLEKFLTEAFEDGEIEKVLSGYVNDVDSKERWLRRGIVITFGAVKIEIECQVKQDGNTFAGFLTLKAPVINNNFVLTKTLIIKQTTVALLSKGGSKERVCQIRRETGQAILNLFSRLVKIAGLSIV